MTASDMTTPSPGREQSIDCDALIASIALEFARVRKITSGATVNFSENHEALLAEFLERLSDVFEDNEVEFRDHTGDPWLEGLPLTVVHIRDETLDPVVVETLRPSISRNGRIISHGYVVIGEKTEMEQAK